MQSRDRSVTSLAFGSHLHLQAALSRSSFIAGRRFQLQTHTHNRAPSGLERMPSATSFRCLQIMSLQIRKSRSESKKHRSFGAARSVRKPGGLQPAAGRSPDDAAALDASAASSNSCRGRPAVAAEGVTIDQAGIDSAPTPLRSWPGQLPAAHRNHIRQSDCRCLFRPSPSEARSSTGWSHDKLGCVFLPCECCSGSGTKKNRLPWRQGKARRRRSIYRCID
jgi:hypothetical protein